MTADPALFTTQPARRCAVVIDPATAGPDHGRQIRIALEQAGWSQPLWLETTPDDRGPAQASRAVAAGVKVLFACGGDGTVRSCVNALAGTEVALAVLPNGSTANLLATSFALPCDVPGGVAVATTGVRRRIDVGAVQDQCFAGMARMGFEPKVPVQQMTVWVRLDDAPAMRRRAGTVLIANAGRLPGGMLLAQADPADGWLDVAIVSPRTLWHWLMLVTAVMRRPEPPRFETYRARRVEVTSDRSQPRVLDGEVIASSRTLSVVVRPGALLICVPR